MSFCGAERGSREWRKKRLISRRDRGRAGVAHPMSGRDAQLARDDKGTAGRTSPSRPKIIACSLWVGRASAFVLKGHNPSDTNFHALLLNACVSPLTNRRQASSDSLILAVAFTTTTQTRAYACAQIRSVASRHHICLATIRALLPLSHCC